MYKKSGLFDCFDAVFFNYLYASVEQLAAEGDQNRESKYWSSGLQMHDMTE